MSSCNVVSRGPSLAAACDSRVRTLRRQNRAPDTAAPSMRSRLAARPQFTGNISSAEGSYVVDASILVQPLRARGERWSAAASEGRGCAKATPTIARDTSVTNPDGMFDHVAAPERPMPGSLGLARFSPIRAVPAAKWDPVRRSGFGPVVSREPSSITGAGCHAHRGDIVRYVPAEADFNDSSGLFALAQPRARESTAPPWTRTPVCPAGSPETSALPHA